jgi:hypothetical protein
MAGMLGGFGALAVRLAIVALILGAAPGFAAAVPPLAQGGAALLAPDLKEAGKPVKPAQAEGGPADAASAAQAEQQPKPSLTASLMKYGPSYVLMVLLVGLGAFIACAPRPGALAQSEAGKDKGKGPGKK